MAFVITQRCCNDASCVDMCPVDCIRPWQITPIRHDRDALYRPGSLHRLRRAWRSVRSMRSTPRRICRPLKRYNDINAAYFDRHPLHADCRRLAGPEPVSRRLVADGDVGAGPAACYAAASFACDGVEVDLFERLPTPYGLIRAAWRPRSAHQIVVASSIPIRPRYFRLPLQRRSRTRRQPRRDDGATIMRSSMRSGHRGGETSPSPGRTCREVTPRPTLSPGTTAIPTTPTSSSIYLDSGRFRWQRQRRTGRRADPDAAAR